VNQYSTKSSSASNASKISPAVPPPGGTTTSDIYQTIINNIGLFGQSGYQASMTFNSGTLGGVITFSSLTLTFVPNSGNNGVQSVTIAASTAQLNLGGGVTSSVGSISNLSYNLSTHAFSMTLNTVGISFSSFLNLSATTVTLNYTGSTQTAATIDVLSSDGKSITTATASVTTLTLGITGGSIFAGVNGPTSTSPNAQGLSISGVNMALALLYDNTGNTFYSSSADSYAGDSFYAFQLSGGTNLKAVGLPNGFAFNASNLTANLNGSINSSGTSESNAFWLDFSTTYSSTSGLQVGGIALDYSKSVFQVGAAVTFNFDGFIYVNGTFTF
jgi:hypothetical protein